MVSPLIVQQTVYFVTKSWGVGYVADEKLSVYCQKYRRDVTHPCILKEVVDRPTLVDCFS